MKFINPGTRLYNIDMLIYAAIVPHPPFALPSIGKEHAKLFTTTAEACLKIAEDIALLSVNSILFITQHGERYKNAVALAMHDPFAASVMEYGDMGLTASYDPDLKLIDKIQRRLKESGVDKTLTTNETVDGATSVALLLLGESVKKIRIALATPPKSDGKSVLRAGEAIRESIEESSARIAVVCVADLCGGLSPISEYGENSEATKCSETIKHHINDCNRAALINAQKKSSKLIRFADLDSLIMFFGIIGDSRVRPEEYAFEAPLGTGHLTEAFHFI